MAINNSNFKIKNGAEVLGFASIGNAGTPDRPLVVSSANNPLAAGQPSIVLQGDVNKERIAVRSGAVPVVFLGLHHGSVSAPTAVLNGDGLGSFQMGGYDGADWVRSCWMATFAAENWSTTARGADIVFSTTPIGSITITERLRIGSGGQLGIGGQNYGTAGQVLTSGGAGSAPSWTTPPGSLTITDDTTANSAHYLTLTSSTSGTLSALKVSSSKLQFNPSTGNLGLGGDFTTYRSYATSTGFLYFGNTGTKYCGFDGTNFVSSMPMAFNISGNATTATSATSALYQSMSFGASSDLNTYFTETGSQLRAWREAGWNTNSPGGTWWFIENMRHSNGSNYWGRQNAWGWEDNANEFYSRNISGGTWGSWVRFLHSGNFSSYALPINSGTANELYNNGWFRSNGNVGWYSQTYGGGIYMSDTAYVRTYNNKSFVAHSYVEYAQNFGTVSGAQTINVLNGSMVSMTVNAATTFTFSGAHSAGYATSFTLELTNGGAVTITWPSGTKWAGGIAPTLTGSGTDILSFYTRDGGTTWRGVLVSKDNR